MKPFRITGDRIGIGFLSNEDIPAVMDFYKRNGGRIAKYNPDPPNEYQTPEYWGTKIRFRNSSLKRERALDFYLFLPDLPQRITGHIRLFNIESYPRYSCEIGYTIDQLLEGGGYMAEALCLALTFAKEGLAIHRVVALCHPQNSRSKKLLASLGFREEGVLHESMLQDGVWQDMILYARIL
jgi:ribosomal-protein-alanine N-acetyltransferase